VHTPVNLSGAREGGGEGGGGSHALCTALQAGDEGNVRQVEITRGDITAGRGALCVAAFTPLTSWQRL